MEAKRQVAAIAIAAVGLLLGSLRVADASSIVDQSYAATSEDGSFIIADRFNVAQTFTVGLTGLLTSVDVEIRNLCASPTDCFEPQVPLVVDVRTTAAGVPTEPNSGPNVLGSASLAWINSPFGPFAFVNFDLPDFAVAAGDVLALVLTAPGSGPFEPYVWRGDLGTSYSLTPGTYLGGTVYTRGSGGTWSNTDGFESLAEADMSFRTYVDVGFQAVPEPASMTLLAFGLASAAVARRRRKTS